MIATLRGDVSEKLGNMVVLDVGGVGYGLYVTVEDYGELILGKSAKFYVYEHIRENSHELFGFTKLATKQLFDLLLAVNGVGPRMASAIVGLGVVDDVRLAIAEGNTKYIQTASGVGRRVAERIIVDLKDKVGLAADDNATSFLQTPSNDEAAQALVALGFTPQDAAHALKNIDTNLSIEERLKRALKTNP